MLLSYEEAERRPAAELRVTCNMNGLGDPFRLGGEQSAHISSGTSLLKIFAHNDVIGCLQVKVCARL